MTKKTFKVKRLRDEHTMELEPMHALNLLRNDAKNSKPEFELAETNYTFSDNEIHKGTNNRNSEKPEAEGKNK